MTLPRWIEATRSGSPQIVLEPDAGLTELVRRELPLPRRHRIRVRPQDGLTGVRALGTDSADVLVTDAYAGGRVPAELSSAAYVHEVARVLKPEARHLEPRRRARDALCGKGARDDQGELPHVGLIATHEVLKRRRFGNSVVVASAVPLPDERLRRGVARANLPTGLRRIGPSSTDIAGAKPLDDGGMPSPPAPDPRLARRLRFASSAA